MLNAQAFYANSGYESALVSGATGTALGNMTANGGLAAAFNGTTSQTQAASCAKGISDSGYANYVGKDWGAGNTKIISGFNVYGPNDTNILGAAGGTNIKLQGSSDNFSSSVVDLIAAIAFPTGSSQSLNTITGIDMSTAYRYHRLVINGNGSNTAAVAELIFTERLK